MVQSGRGLWPLGSREGNWLGTPNLSENSQGLLGLKGLAPQSPGLLGLPHCGAELPPGPGAMLQGSGNSES